MRIAAWLVHLFTAAGSICALLATLAVVDRAWEAAFAWLGLALLIDGADGPIARAVGVKSRLPRFSGEQLDLVVDYVTYVFVPTLALVLGSFLVGAVGLVLAAGILVSSLYHFADLDSKASDLSFVGFPAVWNLVAFYLFAFGVSPGWSAAVVAICVALAFVRTHWVHPMRVLAMRPVTIGLVGLWFIAAGAVLWAGFAAPPTLALAVLALVALYVIALSLAVLTWRAIS